MENKIADLDKDLKKEAELEKSEKQDIEKAEQDIDKEEKLIGDEEQELSEEEKKSKDIEKEISSEEKKVEEEDESIAQEDKKEVDESKDEVEEFLEKEITSEVQGPLQGPLKAPVKEEEPEEKSVDVSSEVEMNTHIYGLRTMANREDQVASFVASNVQRKKLPVYSVVRPHGMRGYIFLEAESIGDAEQAAFGVPYARGVLPKEVKYAEIEHMLEKVKKDVNIQKNDIAEIISGPFKREKAKITRVDKGKEEVVVELLEAAVPIPITVKIDAVKVIRRDKEE